VFSLKWRFYLARPRPRERARLLSSSSPGAKTNSSWQAPRSAKEVFGSYNASLARYRWSPHRGSGAICAAQRFLSGSFESVMFSIIFFRFGLFGLRSGKGFRLDWVKSDPKPNGIDELVNGWWSHSPRPVFWPTLERGKPFDVRQSPTNHNAHTQSNTTPTALHSPWITPCADAYFSVAHDASGPQL
jgi:hypothetical protein